MRTSTAVRDESLASTIKQARSRVVLVTPGVSEVVARAIDTLTAAPQAPKAALIPDVPVLGGGCCT